MTYNKTNIDHLIAKKVSQREIELRDAAVKCHINDWSSATFAIMKKEIEKRYNDEIEYYKLRKEITEEI